MLDGVHKVHVNGKLRDPRGQFFDPLNPGQRIKNKVVTNIISSLSRSG